VTIGILACRFPYLATRMASMAPLVMSFVSCLYTSLLAE